ncbi:MAG TPA: preprotein translocase subunit SecE [Bacillales bacterium]|jgi:preprotein translocase subunit SecE|nr:preprotein translocase subunit SecE [Bacillales bacterium]
MANIFDHSAKFFRNVISELKRVSWPTRRQLISYTVTVLVTVAFVAVFFAILDYGISKLIRLVL